MEITGETANSSPEEQISGGNLYVYKSKSWNGYWRGGPGRSRLWRLPILEVPEAGQVR